MTSARDGARLVEAELAEQRHGWWEALVRLTSAIVLVLDESGRVLYVNGAARAVLGIEPESLLGTDVFELVHPNDLANVLDDFAQRLHVGGPNFLTRFRARAADGTWRDLAAYGADVRDEPGAGALIVHATDITSEVEADAALRNSEERFRSLVQQSSDFIALLDPDGILLYTSPALDRVLGVNKLRTPTAESVMELVHPDDVHRVRAALGWMTRHNAPSAPLEVRVRADDGTWRVLEVIGRNQTSEGAIGGIVINARDVTDRHRARTLLEAQASLLEGVARRVPLESTLLEIGRAIEQQVRDVLAVVGLLEPESGVRMLASASVPADVLGNIRDRLVGAQHPLGEALRTGGELVFPEVATDPVWADVRPLLGPLGEGACWIFPIVSPVDDAQSGFLALLSANTGAPPPDATSVARWAVHLAAIAVERQRTEDQLRHQALHDHLTGLPNRTLLLDRIEQALARAARHGTDVAVLFVDLDQFKMINDGLGHAGGDELLERVAERLVRVVPPDDTVGRFGGDEFVVVGEDVAGDLGAVALAERITEALQEPFVLGDDLVTISGSVGIVLADRGVAVDPAELVRNADAAMYRAKGQGRGTHAMFEQALHDRLVERMLLERDLRLAVPREELELHYQPVLKVDDATIVGVEALLRWNRPEHGLVAPGDFIPAAEETGLIVSIGRWVLGEVCRQASTWRDDPVLGKLRISANLSARQLADPNLIDVVREALQGNDLEPGRLVLEVTESAVVDDLDAAHEVLTHLHLLGVGISIDDFGTGWASLDYVRRFTVADELKIDRSFVADLELGTRADEAIVSASIVLAASLGLEVVAEGVETARQFEALQRLGCGRAQGFLFSRAVTVDELAPFVLGFAWPTVPGHAGPGR